ncbi:hypothetical protein [Dactylosporangium sp. CS-033363]|uniref:hypothetical protein n=1 Tax=Dactylosporangium sp. CS-033363 TaxID=3239935 RepID=UPI003D901DD6
MDRALERLRRIGDAAGDSRALRAAALAELARVVPFDAYVWPLTDPETAVGTAPLASVPPALMPELPRLIRLKYLTKVNRWTGLSAAARLDAPAESLLWRELLCADRGHRGGVLTRRPRRCVRPGDRPLGAGDRGAPAPDRGG